MTTPERLRRRQRIETALVGLVMVVVGLSQYTAAQDRKEQARIDTAQEQCVAKQVTEITEALNARSESSGRLNDATADVLDSFVGAAAAKKEGTQTEEERSRPIIKALERYAEVRDEVKKSRKNNPFPAFPTGKCENG